MPYTIIPKGNQFCIFKKDAKDQPVGESIHCHPTRKAAVAQIAALMASEADEQQSGQRASAAPPEDSGEGFCVCLECGYRAPHTQGAACVDKTCPKCGAELSNEDEEKESATEDHVEVMGKAKERTLFKNIMQYVAKALGLSLSSDTLDLWDDEHMERVLEQVKVSNEPTGFFTIRESADRYRWVGVSSTNHQDRTKEIITERALELDVKANSRNRGELVYWHEKQIPLATCDFGVVSDGFLIESGIWYGNTEAVGFREETQRNPDAWKLSIGFYTATRAIEIHQVVRGMFIPAIHNLIVIEERSVLPADQAANMFTAFTSSVKGEQNMTMRADKKDVLTQVLGQSVADALEARIAVAQKEAEDAKTASKETPKTAREVVEYLRETGQGAYADVIAALPGVAPTAEEIDEQVLTSVREFVQTLQDSGVKTRLLEALTPAPAPAPVTVEIPPTVQPKEREEIVPVTPPAEDPMVAMLAQLREQISTLTARVTTMQPKPPEEVTRAALVRPSQREGNIDENAPKVKAPVADAGEATVGNMAETLFDRILGNSGGN